MPSIIIDHVVSCSSADKNNPVENLLKGDGTHKWKSAAVGEKRVSAVLQFSKSSEIHSIDIGNEGSAFVEILVGKAAAAADQDFEVLLVASAFMSPLESRNGNNRNSVRMFGPEKLNKQVTDKKWDRVKIVCTQPFSKLEAYGLSFIKFHSSPSGSDGEGKGKKFGAFTIKDADDDDDDILVGSLFANRGKVDVPATPKGAAAVRAATKIADVTTRLSSPAAAAASSSPANERKRPASPSLTYENNLKAKAVKTSNDDSGDDEKRGAARSLDKPTLKKQPTSMSSVASSHCSSSKEEKPSLKKNKTEPTKSSTTVTFSKLMAKTVFVLSGFQNPYRAELRDQAVEMGAQYRPDWGRGCTHLICAFANTPKYQQVKGKGKIVTKRWILDCYKQKKLFPWRKYRLGDAESPDESSSEEEEEYKPQQKVSTPPKPSSSAKESKPQVNPRNIIRKGVRYEDDSDSGGDTDDELRKVAEKAKGGPGKKSPAVVSASTSSSQANKDPYANSTDEDENDREKATMSLPDDDDDDDNEGSDLGLPDLPDFFSDKHFFFYGDFETAEKRLLTRYIAAYNGEVEDYMSPKVNFVITSQKWDDNFETALNDNSGLIFVKPKWILTCHERGSLAPYQPHIVVPS